MPSTPRARPRAAAFGALGLTGGQGAGWKAAADPEEILGAGAELQQVEAVKLQEGDAAGQRFAALADQLHRSGAEQQEATRSFSSPATSIDHPPQLREQPWQSLHFIEDHQLVGMTRQKKRRFRQAGPIGGRLQVEVEAGDRLRQLEGQGGLAHLARPEQRHRRKLLQLLPHPLRLQPRNPSGISWQIGHDVPDLQGSLAMEGWPRRLGWGLRLPLVENLPGPLDVGQQGRLADGGESGEVDHPGQEQVIEVGIDPGKGGGAEVM